MILIDQADQGARVLETVECRAGEEIWIGEDVRVAVIGPNGDTLFLFVEAPAYRRLRCGQHPKHLMRSAHGRRLYLVRLPSGGEFRLDEITATARLLPSPPGTALLRDTAIDIDAPSGESIERRRSRPDALPESVQVEDER